MITKTTEFEGTMYGNGEQKIFAITKDSYVKIFNEIPEDYDEDYVYKNLNSMYPDYCYPELESGKMYKFEVTIKAIPINEERRNNNEDE